MHNTQGTQLAKIYHSTNICSSKCHTK